MLSQRLLSSKFWFWLTPPRRLEGQAHFSYDKSAQIGAGTMSGVLIFAHTSFWKSSALPTERPQKKKSTHRGTIVWYCLNVGGLSSLCCSSSWMMSTNSCWPAAFVFFFPHSCQAFCQTIIMPPCSRLNDQDVGNAQAKRARLQQGIEKTLGMSFIFQQPFRCFSVLLSFDSKAQVDWRH